MKNHLLVFFAILNSVRSTEQTQKDQTQDQRRIINGQTISITNAKFMASLILHNPRAIRRDRLVCGAVIIADHQLLTMASCLSKIDEKLINQRMVFVRSNTADYDKSSGSKHDHYINQHQTHPNYRNGFHEYDIALIEVEQSFSGKNEKQIPLVKPTYKYPAGTKANIYGWGIKSLDVDDSSTNLQKAKVTLIDDNLCDQLLHDVIEYNYAYDYDILTTNMVCTQGLSDAIFCTGDEGGALVQANKLIGLISWNIKCGNQSSPQVYTKITYFLNWINETLTRKVIG